MKHDPEDYYIYNPVQEFPCRKCGIRVYIDKFNRKSRLCAFCEALDALPKHCVMTEEESKAMREFGTGATRTSQEGRYDPEGYMSPLVEERFSEYMLKNELQADGKRRESDNWQKGMSLQSYAKGLKRHVLHFWLRHRGWPVKDVKAASNVEEDLCAIIFNAQGYLHTLLENKVHGKLEDSVVRYKIGIDDGSES